MNATEIALVQTSFRRLIPAADRVALLFFSRLLDLDPALRHELGGGSPGQGRQFVQALALAVNGLSHPATLAPVVRRAGMRGAGLFLGNGRLEAIGAALLWALETAADQPFALETRNAWTRAYWFLANLLRSGAREAGRGTPAAA